jgi:indolepyruvate ferredoxin oxidoreductase beta subunit
VAAALPPAVAGRFPQPLHAMLAIGRARVLEYQDAAYASLYDDRLAGVLAAEQAADPAGVHGLATTREVARWLALWMAFDDIVRVAQLKVRASRLARVRSEVRAANGDVLKVFDHFKPGIAEVAGLLPPGPAQALIRWDRRRVAAGKPPWALPLKLPTHTVIGNVALGVLGSLKGMRRRGQRFAQEQALIERWLATVRDLSVPGDGGWQQGHEVALCGRLIKGYGTTNERGKARLLHVLDHLAVGARFASAADRARAIAQVREAALADDAGKALDQALARHGVAPSPPAEQPIRFVRRRPALSR